MKTRVRAMLPSLALAIGSILLTLAVLEAAFRTAGVHVGTVQISRRTMRRTANPRLKFELRPGSVARAEVVYRINAHGMRDRPREIDKPAGMRRIAVLGDSITFGYWVAEEDAFPHQLEGLLGPGVEVLNFGVPGYNLEQETEILRERALGFSPDVVIVALCLNDLEGADSYEHGLVMDRRLRTASLAGRAWEALLGRSLLLSWIEYRRAEHAARREFVKARDPWAGPLYAETPTQQEDALTARFRTVASLLESGGKVPGLVAVFPTFGGHFDRYRHADFHRIAARAAAQAGLGLVDLIDCFRGYDFRDVRVDVVHPSPLGHRVAAHALADALCARGWPCPPAGRRCREYRRDEFKTVRGY
jgi:lysophospholipase L1-like esterase